MTFSSALFLLVLGLLRGNDEGWGSTLIVSLLAGSGVPDGRVPRRSRRASRSRCSRWGCSGSRAFTGVQLAALGVSASMFALFLYLTLYLQGFLGSDPLEAGLRYLPVTVTNFFVAAATGALLSRVQARFLIGGGLAHHRAGPAPDGRHP